MSICSIQAEFYTGEPHPPNHASTPGAFPMASVVETREAPSIEGASLSRAHPEDAPINVVFDIPCTITELELSPKTLSCSHLGLVRSIFFLLQDRRHHHESRGRR